MSAKVLLKNILFCILLRRQCGSLVIITFKTSYYGYWRLVCDFLGDFIFQNIFIQYWKFMNRVSISDNRALTLFAALFHKILSKITNKAELLKLGYFSKINVWAVEQFFLS